MPPRTAQVDVQLTPLHEDEQGRVDTIRSAGHAIPERLTVIQLPIMGVGLSGGMLNAQVPLPVQLFDVPEARGLMLPPGAVENTLTQRLVDNMVFATVRFVFNHEFLAEHAAKVAPVADSGGYLIQAWFRRKVGPPAPIEGGFPITLPGDGARADLELVEAIDQATEGLLGCVGHFPDVQIDPATGHLTASYLTLTHDEACALARRLPQLTEDLDGWVFLHADAAVASIHEESPT